MYGGRGWVYQRPISESRSFSILDGALARRSTHANISNKQLTSSAKFLLQIHQQVGALLVWHQRERVVWINSFQLWYKMSIRLLDVTDLSRICHTQTSHQFTE